MKSCLARDIVFIQITRSHKLIKETQMMNVANVASPQNCTLNIFRFRSFSVSSQENVPVLMQ